jgi:hypothetical protein
VIVLKQGSVIFNGKAEESLNYYGASGSVSGSIDLASKKPGAYLQSLNIIQNGKSSSGILKAGDKVDLVFSFKNLQGAFQDKTRSRFYKHDGRAGVCGRKLSRLQSDASAKARCYRND